MPQLRENHAAFGVHCVGHVAPAVDLLVAVDAGRPRVTLPARLDLRALADHESRTGALAIVERGEFGGDVAGLGASLARQWR
jgi:hypothetical protein